MIQRSLSRDVVIGAVCIVGIIMTMENPSCQVDIHVEKPEPTITPEPTEAVEDAVEADEIDVGDEEPFCSAEAPTEVSL